MTTPSKHTILRYVSYVAISVFLYLFWWAGSFLFRIPISTEVEFYWQFVQTFLGFLLWITSPIALLELLRKFTHRKKAPD